MIRIRDEEMTELIRFRATPTDKESIKKAANKLGLNSSCYIRMLLIQSGAIKA